jgi:hypothetical protein
MTDEEVEDEVLRRLCYGFPETPEELIASLGNPEGMTTKDVRSMCQFTKTATYTISGTLYGYGSVSFIGKVTP